MRILFIGAGRMGLPIISSWKKGSRHKSIDIHLVEKLEANINKVKKVVLMTSIFYPGTGYIDKCCCSE